MRNEQTGQSQRPTLRLVGGGKDESGTAYSPFGLLNQSSTISQRINREAQLLELLNSCEKRIETLESKYLEVSNTLIDVMARLVRLGSFTFDTTTTDVVE